MVDTDEVLNSRGMHVYELGLVGPARRGLGSRSDLSHRSCSRRVMSLDVTDHHAERTGRRKNHVVEVAADFRPWAPAY